MWCKQCRQDVPGMVCSESGDYRCPRCAQSIYSPLNDALLELAEGLPPDADGEGEPPGKFPPRFFDDWEVEDQLEHLGRVLRQEKSQTAQPVGLRIDAAHQGLRGPHRPRSRRPKARPQAEDRFSLTAFLTWSLLSLGLMTFVCGGVLMGWSIVSTREDLWSIGLPTTLGGQLALVIGLILQLDGLGQARRRAAVKADREDEREDLKTATSPLYTPQGVSRPDFYAHLASGAGPHLLLTDLKGQLDLLAKKIGKAKA